MRTQLILTTAALGVASSLGAFAQVYSVNAVGYINVTVPARGYALVANQLNVAGGNLIKDVLGATLPEGTIAFLYTQAGGFAANPYEFGEWGNPNAVLAPGSGFFLQNNGTAALTVTFVGEVPQGTLTNPLLTGLNLVSSQVPQAGTLVTALGFPAVEGDQIVQWNNTTQNYNAVNAFEFGVWSGGEPTIAVGEGFFVRKNGAGSWNRTFSVNS